MSDFLAVFGRRVDAESLLEFIRLPYAGESRTGIAMNHQWGSLAILQEPFSREASTIRMGNEALAWVGDLHFGADSRVLDSLLLALSGAERHHALPLACELNGAFALLHANDNCLHIITDIGGFTPVYVALDASGGVLALGTHADLVAVAGFSHPDIDMVSLAHFLDYGHAGPPGTMHQGVSMLQHASLHTIKNTPNEVPRIGSVPYWTPPHEESTRSEQDFADELRGIIISTVADRCQGEKIAVCLSGGLDSRVILSAVPAEIDCTALTFYDKINREALTACAVSGAYNRKWLPLQRSEEYLFEQLDAVLSFCGGEGEWVTAHELGFVGRMREEGYSSVLHGLNFDSFLKGYNAKDLKRKKRMGGLLRPQWEKVDYDYADEPNKHLKKPLVRSDFREAVVTRRRELAAQYYDANRQSLADILGSFPFFRRFHANWISERRLIPLRMPALDKRIIDFMFRCPTGIRMEGRLLAMAAKELLKPSRNIPNANTGVRFASTPLGAMAQRARRLAVERSSSLVRKALGLPETINHSWHDYDHYWKTSVSLQKLVASHGKFLEPLESAFFISPALTMLRDPDLHWTSGFRLIQIALWLERMPAYSVAFENLSKYPALLENSNLE